MIFSGATNRVRSYKGVVAVAIWGVIAGLASSGIKKAPVAVAGLPCGATIMDPAQSATWMSSDTSMSYKGDTLVSFGIGIDLAHDLSGYRQEDLDALYYANRQTRGAQR